MISYTTSNILTKTYAGLARSIQDLYTLLLHQAFPEPAHLQAKLTPQLAIPAHTVHAHLWDDVPASAWVELVSCPRFEHVLAQCLSLDSLTAYVQNTLPTLVQASSPTLSPATAALYHAVITRLYVYAQAMEPSCAEDEQHLLKARQLQELQQVFALLGVIACVHAHTWPLAALQCALAVCCTGASVCYCAGQLLASGTAWLERSTFLIAQLNSTTPSVSASRVHAICSDALHTLTEPGVTQLAKAVPAAPELLARAVGFKVAALFADSSCPGSGGTSLCTLVCCAQARAAVLALPGSSPGSAAASAEHWYCPALQAAAQYTAQEQAAAADVAAAAVQSAAWWGPPVWQLVHQFLPPLPVTAPVAGKKRARPAASAPSQRRQPEFDGYVCASHAVDPGKMDAGKYGELLADSPMGCIGAIVDWYNEHDGLFHTAQVTSIRLPERPADSAVLTLRTLAGEHKTVQASAALLRPTMVPSSLLAPHEVTVAAIASASRPPVQSVALPAGLDEAPALAALDLAEADQLVKHGGTVGDCAVLSGDALCSRLEEAGLHKARPIAILSEAMCTPAGQESLPSMQPLLHALAGMKMAPSAGAAVREFCFALVVTALAGLNSLGMTRSSNMIDAAVVKAQRRALDHRIAALKQALQNRRAGQRSVAAMFTAAAAAATVGQRPQQGSDAAAPAGQLDLRALVQTQLAETTAGRALRGMEPAIRAAMQAATAAALSQRSAPGLKPPRAPWSVRIGHTMPELWASLSRVSTELDLSPPREPGHARKFRKYIKFLHNVRTLVVAQCLAVALHALLPVQCNVSVPALVTHADQAVGSPGLAVSRQISLAAGSGASEAAVASPPDDGQLPRGLTNMARLCASLCSVQTRDDTDEACALAAQWQQLSQLLELASAMTEAGAEVPSATQS